MSEEADTREEVNMDISSEIVSTNPRIDSSILTFNSSTTDKLKLSKIKDPFQILPGGRTSLTTKAVDEFVEMKNENILIHANYTTRPFNLEISPITRLNISNYVKLCGKLGTKNILIHLPANVNEYENFGIGIQFIIENIISHNCFCHLEIAPLSKDLQKHLKITKENSINKYIEYIDYLLSIIPEKYRKSFYLVPDTAHLFANGFDGLDTIEFIEKYRKLIRYIHFNGNKNYQFTRDQHIPIFESGNKIKNIDELTSYISKLNVILVAEDSTEKTSYDKWKNFCSKFKLKIVEFNSLYSI